MCISLTSFIAASVESLEVKRKQAKERKSGTSEKTQILENLLSNSDKTSSSEKDETVLENKNESSTASNKFSQKRDFNKSFLSFVDNEIQKTIVHQNNLQKFMNDSARKVPAADAIKTITVDDDDDDDNGNGSPTPSKRLCITSKDVISKGTLSVKPITTLLETPKVQQYNRPRILVHKSGHETKTNILKPVQPPKNTVLKSSEVVVQNQVAAATQNVFYFLGPSDKLNTAITQGVAKPLALPLGMVPQPGGAVAVPGLPGMLS